MKTNLRFLMILIGSLAIGLTSCKKDPAAPDATLTVDPVTQSVAATAGTSSFAVTSNSTWTVTSDQSWCVVTSGGVDNGTIVANYTENTTETERTANITVAVTGVDPILLTLTQAGVAAKTIEVSGEITGNVTWTADHQYLIKGFTYVVDGAQLTIEPGTIIKGDKLSIGTLIVERGAKIIANGTSNNPIVFTSAAPVGFRNRGDWGGVVLCGKAPVNNGDPQIEGGPRSHYGGTDAADNSGSMKYVRIEYAGYPLQPDKEINGLTFAGVGSGTTIDYIMVAYSNDDSFEWFGGTVNAKHLIAYRGLDDDFDTDNGFSGKLQYLLAVRDKAVADVSGSNGFESDNDATGSTNTPITSPIFSNVTLIGPRASSSTSNINAQYKNAMHLRRNTQLSTYNSVFAGHMGGLLLDGTLTQENATNDILQIRNTVIAGVPAADKFFLVPSGSTMSASALSDWFLTPGYNNSTILDNADLKLTDAFNIDLPNAMPMTGSPLLDAASFTNTRLQDAFFTPETFIGAFGSTDWTSGWVVWDSQNLSYDAK